MLRREAEDLASHAVESYALDRGTGSRPPSRPFEGGRGAVMDEATMREGDGRTGGHRLEFLPIDAVEADVVRACAAELGALLATGAPKITLDDAGGGASRGGLRALWCAGVLRCVLVDDGRRALGRSGRS